MSDDWSGTYPSADLNANLSDMTPPEELMPLEEVAQHMDVTPDGHQVVVTGDVEADKDLNHLQGQNDLHFRGTCGLVSCEDVLRQHGIEVSENDVVNYAATHGLCAVSDDPDHSGGTTPELRAQILSELGVPSHAEHNRTPEQLAEDIESGKSVIVGVNAGVLFDDPNSVGQDPFQSNHAITVTGVARDAQTGEVAGFYVNDSGGFAGATSPDGVGSGHFVDIQHMNAGWTQAGGSEVISDAPRPDAHVTSDAPQPAAVGDVPAASAEWPASSPDGRYAWK